MHRQNPGRPGIVQRESVPTRLRRFIRPPQCRVPKHIRTLPALRRGELVGPGNRPFRAFQRRGVRHVVVVGSWPPDQLGPRARQYVSRKIVGRETRRYPVPLAFRDFKHEVERQDVRAVFCHQLQRFGGLPVECGNPQRGVIAAVQPPGVAAVFRRGPHPPFRPHSGLGGLSIFHRRCRTDVDGMPRRCLTRQQLCAGDIVVRIPAERAFGPSQGKRAARGVRVRFRNGDAIGVSFMRREGGPCSRVPGYQPEC